MGNYVYAVRRKSIQAIMPDGNPITVWMMKYLYKPSYSRDYFNRPYEATISRLENVWASKNEKPDYIAHVDQTWEEGTDVRQWPGLIAYNDGCLTTPGSHVGYLKRIGKQWHVVKEMSEGNK
jgi:hypothetical protein